MRFTGIQYLVAWIGVVLCFIWFRAARHSCSRMARWTRIAAAAFCCALIVPSPTRGSVEFYRNYYRATSEFADLGADRKLYLEKKVRGYRAVEAVIKTLKSEHKQQTRVLMLMIQPHFYFREKANITSVGDYFGPARYGDLFEEVSTSEHCLSYLTRLDISAVIAQSPGQKDDMWWPRFYAKFRTRLTDCGYIEYRCGKKDVAVFLKSGIKPHVSLQPAP